MELNAEMLVIIIILAVGALLCAEYIWLYIIANRQEETLLRNGEYDGEIHNCFEAILGAPTQLAQSEEIGHLCEYVKNDYEKFDIAACKLLELQNRSADLSEEKRQALLQLAEQLQPVETYQSYFDNGNDYLKGYICRRLADFKSTDSIERLRQCVDSKNKTLQYNGAMALSVLGDEEYMVKYLSMCEDNRKYSYRVIVELLDLYTGDKASLARRVFADCSDYMKATVIKGIAQDGIRELTDVYIEGMRSTNPQIKIACVKALSVIADPSLEHLLIIALNDKNWVVRSSAVRGLQKIKSPAALGAVEHATGDEEWWVRQIAAKALVEMDDSMEHVEAVLQGYDKYAADAVKNTLYKIINMGGEDSK